MTFHGERRKKTNNACPGLNGEPCGRPRESQQAHCAKHRRLYQKKWRQERSRARLEKKKRELVDLRALVQLALTGDMDQVERRAYELAEEYELELPDTTVAKHAPGKRFQALLDKYAATE